MLIPEKMSKFANSPILRGRVVGIFPSRGSTILHFACICLHFVLYQNCGEKAENADLKSQNRWIIGQKCNKSEKCLFSHFVQIMGDKEYESGVLGAEVGEMGKENAFFVQLEDSIH
ncbi:MAG: hypothetical protein Q4F52_03315 [Bacteroidaceae bacterium]|nr:hypothetical protein [Bacteroidaceae bacterium]